jgi:hypothetical protein
MGNSDSISRKDTGTGKFYFPQSGRYYFRITEQGIDGLQVIDNQQSGPLTGLLDC